MLTVNDDRARFDQPFEEKVIKLETEGEMHILVFYNSLSQQRRDVVCLSFFWNRFRNFSTVSLSTVSKSN